MPGEGAARMARERHDDLSTRSLSGPEPGGVQ
jgi:hypothetical protein